MRIRTKLMGLMAGVLFGACAFCGVFAVNQYMNASVRKLADIEQGKLELAERAFSQVGTREDFDKMGEEARTLICGISLSAVMTRDMLF